MLLKVVNLTRALAAEWGKHGITVNSICPGYFYTDLTTETLNSEFFQAIAKRSIPLERYGKSGELDTCALFLASPPRIFFNEKNLLFTGSEGGVEGKEVRLGFKFGGRRFI
jgi:gluconate 5-dehydrogenase